MPIYTGFNTINPPNRATCTDPAKATIVYDSGDDGVLSASSYHVGGAHVVMFDSSVRFIPNTIDTTNPDPTAKSTDPVYAPGKDLISGSWVETPNWKAPSPFGVWGAMGTAASELTPLPPEP